MNQLTTLLDHVVKNQHDIYGYVLLLVWLLFGLTLFVMHSIVRMLLFTVFTLFRGYETHYGSNEKPNEENKPPPHHRGFGSE